ncbi:MAG: SMP-30/gluconolactonase/LRE family protein [Gemmataceae bacterium]|nr:SMP-30/gluconolactonase/LRE family protein [Gemmataceae bacterium]MDW8242034.1 SMP-30/gluconolactonase/LRE family protein [Thermogemmata sp.]
MRQAAQVWWRPSQPAEAFLPEGPRWFIWDGQAWIVWVNIQVHPQATHGQILWAPADAPAHYRVVECPGRPGFVLPTEQPGIVLVGMDQALYYLDLATQRWSSPLVVLPSSPPRTTINDGEATPDGQAVVFGTKDLLFREPLGRLYLYHFRQRQLFTLADGQTCSNGKVLRHEADGLILYDIDSPTRQVRRYRLDLIKGSLEDRGIALDLRDWPEFPDGMCAADDTSVIIALYHPGEQTSGRAVRFHLPDARLLEEWETPFSPRVTCPLLFPATGVERTGPIQLLLTTADEGMPPPLRARCTNAGCLFVAETGLQTLPPTPLVPYDLTMSVQ